MSGRIRIGVARSALACMLLIASTVRAQDATPTTPSAVAAQTLFREGRALLEAGDTEAACAKFEGSFKLEPSAMGTLFNLALCNERRGRFATAWSQHMDVLAASRDTRPDRAALAQQRARALEPKLSRVRVVLSPDARTPNLVVTLDGVALPESALTTAIPVDGGEHVIVASAEHYVPIEQRLRAAPEADLVTVTLPPLVHKEEPAPEVAPKAPEDVPKTAPESSRPAIGWLLVGGGLSTAGVGAGFGVTYLADVRDAQRFVDEHPDQYEEMQRRVPTSRAWVANIAIPVGLVVAGIGAVLLLQKPTSHAVAARVPLTSREHVAERSRATLRAAAMCARVGAAR